jgi:hypothetical protein
LKCNNCDVVLLKDDRFCGTCGVAAPPVQRPAPWPGTAGDTSRTLDGRQEETSGPAGTSHPFFAHSAPRETRRLNNATRYLCAAAYLDRLFANRVIWELITSHRAVVPSVNFDVGPVIRHCLQARKNMLLRDITLAVVLLLGLAISRLPTIGFLLISLVLGLLLPSAGRKHRQFGGKLLAGAGVVIAVAAAGIFFAVTLAGTFDSALQQQNISLPALSAQGLSTAALAVLLAVTWGTQIAYTYATFHTLTHRLRQGAQPPRPTGSRAMEARIAMIEAAQWGNVTLYGGENPFIGTGKEVDRHWSIAIELDRARSARQDLAPRHAPRGYVPIDPVELHRAIRERLLKLNDHRLPANERVSALVVNDHLAGSGLVRWDSPLLDMTRKIPYSQASPEAIDALIRHPQAGLRYYQRVSVSDEGPAVTSRGRKIIDGVDQGVAVSAFVHVAVEGRMFYLEFVRTALPPIQYDYRIIDLIPTMSSGKFWAMIATSALKSLFSAVICSPLGIYRALRQMSHEKNHEQESTSPRGRIFGDFGSKVSVRELGAAKKFATYIQQFDVDKYTKVIERLLIETVMDFLYGKGVDISEFVNSAGPIINGDIVNIANLSGNNNKISGRGNTYNK